MLRGFVGVERARAEVQGAVLARTRGFELPAASSNSSNATSLWSSSFSDALCSPSAWVSSAALASKSSRSSRDRSLTGASGAQGAFVLGVVEQFSLFLGARVEAHKRPSMTPDSGAATLPSAQATATRHFTIFFSPGVMTAQPTPLPAPHQKKSAIPRGTTLFLALEEGGCRQRFSASLRLRLRRDSVAVQLGLVRTFDRHA